MGRLQRKKPAEKKKKKSAGDDIAATAQATAAGARGDTAGPGAEKARKAMPALKKVAPAGRPAPVKTTPNVLNKSLQFLREVKVELKKVTWPSRKQTLGSTVVVIILVMIVSLFLGVVDIGLSSLVRVVLQ